VSEPCRFLAVVPARGGSKRLPRKNVLPLGGRPLIAWTITTAHQSGVLGDVLVSTDDGEIAGAARDAGAMVPWLRPAELATDSASSADVLRHALKWYETQHGTVDAVVLLQPTSPFRTAASIRGAVAAFRTQDGQSAQAVVSVGPAASHPAWCFRVEGGMLQPFLGWEPLSQRSQDLEPAFALNGAIYVLPAADVRGSEPLLRPGIRPYVMHDAHESLDIDTPDDWQTAMSIAKGSS